MNICAFLVPSKKYRQETNLKIVETNFPLFTINIEWSQGATPHAGHSAWALRCENEIWEKPTIL